MYSTSFIFQFQLLKYMSDRVHSPKAGVVIEAFMLIGVNGVESSYRGIGKFVSTV